MNVSYIPRVPSRDETEKLVTMLYHGEMAAIKAARYQRSPDKVNDMRACNAARAAAVDLLNQEKADSAFTDPKREEVRQTLWEYVRGALRNGIENIRNMTLRQQYIAEIKKSALHFRKRLSRIIRMHPRINRAITRLRNLARARHPNEGLRGRIARRQRVRIERTRLSGMIRRNLAATARLAEQAVEARNTALTLTRNKLSKPSAAFSKLIKKEGLGLNGLLDKYTRSLFPTTPRFAALTYARKIRVFEEIINASGRASPIITNLSKAMAVMGAATLILILGSVVWDVVESSNPTLTLVKDAVVVGAGFAGAEVGVALGASLGAVGGPLGVFLAGVLGGIFGAFGAGLAADSLFDAMVAAFSGDIPNELTNHRIWGKPILYAPTLPDGAQLSTSLFPSRPL